jgi:hypothetical protein
MVELKYKSTKNLYCLVANAEHTGLSLVEVNKYKGKLEIDLENQRWKESGNWKEIGKYSPDFSHSADEPNIRLLFDRTNLEDFKEALNVTADFHR